MGLLDELFAAADVDNSGTIDFQEFVALMLGYLRSSDWRTQAVIRKTQVVANMPAPDPAESEDDDEEEDEEDEIPEDLADLSPEQQQLGRRYWWKILLI